MTALLPRRTRTRSPKHQKVKEPRPPETVQMPLHTRTIWKHLQLADDGLWAWYLLGNVPWFYGSVPERESTIETMMLRIADLAGYRIRLRCTAQPVPWGVWAERLDKSVRRAGHNPPTNVDGIGWADYLARSQQRMASARLENPRTFIGVRVTTNSKLSVSDVQSLTTHPSVPLGRELSALRTSIGRLNDTMSKDGFNADKLTSRGLGWLMHASIGLGLPVSSNALAGGTDGWGQQDITTFSAPVRATAPPMSPTLTIRGLRDGKEYRREVAILSVGRMDPRKPLNPATSPWIGYSLRMPFPVEWVATFDVRSGQDVAAAAEHTRRRAQNIEEHYGEHGEEPPVSVLRGIADAKRIEDEVHEAPREVAVRLQGPIRLAVSGVDADEVAARVADLTDAYAKGQKIGLEHTYGQYELYREFIPGEPTQPVGFQRSMPGAFLAAGVPNVATGIGDNVGPYIGHVVGGGRRSVHFRSTWGPEHDESGLCVILAALGGGKSVLEGSLADDDVSCGRRVVILDPSGPLFRLVARWPGVARHIDLTGAEPGTLNPYAQVPDPQRRDYTSDSEYATAFREADVERRDLMVDSLMMLLPPQMVAGLQGAGAQNAIEAAVNSAGGDFGTSPWRVIRALEHDTETARQLAGILRNIAQMKGGVLVFPADEHADTFATAVDDNTLLTVITARGMPAPGIGDRAHWSRAERMAVPVLHLAGRYATRLMYADREPKSIYVDEAGIIASGVGSFQQFLLRGSRDSRKHNTFLAIAGQNPGDARQISEEITNLIGTAFVGRFKSAEQARAALPYLGIEQGYGYEKVLTGLGTGEWLMRDYGGSVEKFHNDLAHRPELLSRLDTTPPSSDDDAFTDAEMF